MRDEVSVVDSPVGEATTHVSVCASTTHIISDFLVLYHSFTNLSYPYTAFAPEPRLADFSSAFVLFAVQLGAHAHEHNCIFIWYAETRHCRFVMFSDITSYLCLVFN